MQAFNFVVFLPIKIYKRVPLVYVHQLQVQYHLFDHLTCKLFCFFKEIQYVNATSYS